MCQAKNWGLRPQLTTCASQMSIQRKEGCSSFQTPEKHRLRVPAGFILAGRWALLPRKTWWAAVPFYPNLSLSDLPSLLTRLSLRDWKVQLLDEPWAAVSPQFGLPMCSWERGKGSQGHVA